MNKHELKSLLENIYTALTEEAAAPKLTIQQILDLSTGGVRLGTASDIVPPPPPPKPNRPMTDTLDQLIRSITTLGRMLQTEESVILEPRPEGWVGPWPPGSPEPPKPIFLDPAQLGVPGMYPGSGFPPGHYYNPYDWDRFWERHRVV